MGLVFFRDGDPLLAAEPGFHDQAPGGAVGVAGPFGHTLDKVSELLEDFTENPLAGRSVPWKAASRVVKDLAGCEAARFPGDELAGYCRASLRDFGVRGVAG